MAYNATYGLTRIAYLGFYGDATTPGQPATAKSIWGYVTADTAATVEGAGYFPAASLYTSVAVGDVIEAVMVVGGTPVKKTYVVTASTSSAITIALQTTTAG